MKKFNIEKIVYIIVLLVMILIPLLKLSTYIPTIENFYTNIFEIKRVYVLWGSIFLLLITYIYMIFSGKEKIGIIDIIVYILIILAFFSTGYAINFIKAFFGEDYRYEGLLTILSYYFLILNVKSIKSEKYKRNIIKLFICIGIFQAIYAILQSYTVLPFIRRHSSRYMAMGLCSNPNFFGSYMVMQSLLVGYMYIYRSKKRYLLIYILFSFSLYLAESTGPVLSALCALIFSIFIIPKKIKKIGVLIILMLLSFFCASKSLNFIHVNKFNTAIQEDWEIVEEVSSLTTKPKEKLGNGRLLLWENSLPLVKKYWLFGCGLDNFKDAYPNSGYVTYDKAHNVYLQISITNGIPALILFLLLLFIAFIKGIKYRKSLLFPIYMAFIGYSVQAFLNISVIDVAPYYYIMLGIIFSDNKESNNEDKYDKRSYEYEMIDSDVLNI